ncbi:hypothetical protein HLRTI_002097 [Halorhabdus tiamatea SARL4B]|uniref:Conserved hypothetical membrane protein n=1 Tax=Halorhabdus tiamatea SARL4B TaxID=1033806 RepID=F7PL71_9EURY|nr:hypothetical protein [Halorhabdus tiamatea]ERJ05826.1 hypothetical protein HLRTI_002097 [Halorhabdus tiamatea SARL4B]CCQ34491.1 conserved hypothetical membrane protein [Halorhabdus tiamatea SARL4B]
MADWSDRVEELLYEGEEVTERVSAGDANVIVTTHRVLAFTPEMDGENFRQVERPNVTEVAVRSDGETRFLMTGFRAGLFGVVLLGVGMAVDFGALMGDIDLTDTSTGQLGIGGILGMVQGMISIISSLDDYMRMLGALLLLVALVPVAVYLYSRETRLVLTIAGGADLPIATSPDDAEETVSRLREAILPDGASAGANSRRSLDVLDRIG